MGESQKILQGNKCVLEEKGSQKEGKNSIIQVPVKYVLVREFLQIKSVEKGPFVNSSGKTFHYFFKNKKNFRARNRNFCSQPQRIQQPKS